MTPVSPLNGKLQRPLETLAWMDTLLSTAEMEVSAPMCVCVWDCVCDRESFLKLHLSLDCQRADRLVAGSRPYTAGIGSPAVAVSSDTTFRSGHLLR